jgi:hypothetical protein
MKTSSIFLLQYGEIDQRRVCDFRHPLSVQMGVAAAKAVSEEVVAAQSWISGNIVR